MQIREQIKLVNIALSGTLDLYRIWAKKHQLNYNALVILYTLNDYKKCTQKQICEWWALPKQTVHGILLDFEKKGYITITASTKNRLYQMEENAMHKLGEEKRKQLIESNTKYYELLKEEIENG